MKKCLITLSLLVLAVFMTLVLGNHLNQALVTDAVSKVMVAEKMLYRRGEYERVIVLNLAARKRIAEVLLNERTFHCWFGKSVSLGGVFFFDGEDAETLHIGALKGNVICIDDTYIELKDDFLKACGFSAEEGKTIFNVETRMK